MINADKKDMPILNIRIKDIVSDIHYIVVESNIEGIEVDQNISLQYSPDKHTPFTLITYREIDNRISNICRYYETVAEVEKVSKGIKLKRDIDWAMEKIKNMKEMITNLELTYFER